MRGFTSKLSLSPGIEKEAISLAAAEEGAIVDSIPVDEAPVVAPEEAASAAALGV